ncbi:EPS depolymerase, partial [Serratia sp. M24T3]
MSKYNTGNSLGSTAAKDLYDNAQNFDHLSVDQVNENWNDRLSKSRKTWFGMEQDHARQLISQENRFQDFLLDSGYEFLGLYVNGPLTFTARNQFTLFDNQYYRLNKNTAVGFKTTGIDAASFTNDVTHFVLMDGDTIRQDLASTTLDDMGDAMVGVLQPFTGAVARTQHDKNQDLTSFADYGGSRSAFDPYTIDDAARATAAAQKTPYAGMNQFVVPHAGLKVWKFL